MRGYVTIGWVLLFVLAVLRGSGQYYFDRSGAIAGNVRYEWGLSAGMMNCFTDLGRGSRHPRSVGGIDWDRFRPATGLYFLAVFRDAVSLRFGYTRGRVSASDADAEDHLLGVAGRRGRNLSFRSVIDEVQLVMELHPLFLKQYETDQSPYLSPYVVAGLGFFHFEPGARLDGKWIPLRLLHLEGQGFPEYPDRKRYHSHAVNLPVGMGVRYELSASWTLQVEWVHRFLFMDYLDDVSTAYVDPALFRKYLSASAASLAERLHNRMREVDPAAGVTPGMQRGSPKSNDAYFTVEVKLGKRIEWRR